MEIVKLNRIRGVLAYSGKQCRWLAQQLGKGRTTMSEWCTNILFSRI